MHDPDAIRGLLVDDQRLLREGLRTLLELHRDLRVVGEAGDGQEAEDMTARLQPQVVLMDLRMPRMDGVTATQRIKQRWPDVQVLVLTTFDDDELVFRSIEAGASGYLLKDLGSDVLAEANREIAERLSLTEGTVKNYISSILAKTGLHDRTQAALFAVRHNLTGDGSL